MRLGQAHAAPSRLARERAALDVEEGRWLLCAWRSSAHVHVGYASFSEYVGRLFGYSARTTCRTRASRRRPGPFKPAGQTEHPPGTTSLTRDRHRCRVPGCTHATFVDVLH